MVVLTIVTENNGETIFFDKPIPQVHFIKLISCSLYNSWDNLKKQSYVTIPATRDTPQVLERIYPGHYNLESFGKTINNLFSDKNGILKAFINKPFGQIVIHNTEQKFLLIGEDLADFLGIKTETHFQNQLSNKKTFIKQITAPTSYFIHCDLIDKTQNLFNHRRSDLLAVVDVKGKPYEKVTYHSSPQQVLRECATDKFINSITLSVKDENGELFDFKGLPLAFELELN